MEKARELFLNFSKNIVYGIFAVIMLYLFWISLFTSCTTAYTDEHTFFIKDFPQLMLPGLLFLLFILFRLKSFADDRGKKRKNICESEKLHKGILTGITIVWFLVLLYWVMKVPVVPKGDQENVFIGAKELLAGDYARWKPGNYMHMYPYQNTMVLFFSVFHFLFHCL